LGQQLQQQPARREAVAWSRELRRIELIEPRREIAQFKSQTPKKQKPHQQEKLNAAVGLNPNESSLDHPHSRSSVQQHATHTARVNPDSIQ
jgi:hypothetical protein